MRTPFANPLCHASTLKHPVELKKIKTFVRKGQKELVKNRIRTPDVRCSLASMTGYEGIGYGQSDGHSLGLKDCGEKKERVGLEKKLSTLHASHSSWRRSPVRPSKVFPTVVSPLCLSSGACPLAYVNVLYAGRDQSIQSYHWC